MKKLALFLAVLLLFSTGGMIVNADSTAEMATAIASVKERVSIPENCTEFNGRKNVYSGETSWEFSWATTEEATPQMQIRVTLRDDMVISSVYSYIFKETTHKPGKTLPVLSAEEAAEKAISFFAGVNPALAKQYAQDAEAVLSGDYYSITIPRIVEGIPVYNNSANLWVCSQTGRVESFSLSHSGKAVFAGTNGNIETEAAKAAYMENGYMRLEYRFFSEEARLVYVPGKSENLISATTGTPFVPDYTGETFDKEAVRGESMMATDAANGAMDTLTPQERKAVEEAAGLISYEEAVEKLKAVPYFRIPDNAVLEAGNTYKEDNERYILRVSLGGEDIAYSYGELDGKTGEILRYYSGSTDKEKKVESADAAKEIYDAFSADYLGTYVPNLAAAETHIADYAVTFSAERTENGIPVYGDGITINVDGEGRITNYRLNWKKDATFPSAEGILSEEQAYAILFENGEPRLQYFAVSGEAPVIYAAAHREFSFISAVDGQLLNYNGKAYVSEKTGSYTDIEGHFAEEAILALASVGARLGDSAFRPDAIITQAEYVGLVSNCVMEYYPLLDGAPDQARLYSYAVNRGILPEAEKAPDTPLTRELAVAYLLRAMGYGEFAEIEGIFQCDFSDSSFITPNLYGYVAIAKGMGFVRGDGNGAFAPQREMTRGEAAAMLYNYLKQR